MKIGDGLRHWGPSSFCLEELWEGALFHLKSLSIFLVATEKPQFLLHTLGTTTIELFFQKEPKKPKKTSIFCLFSWIFLGDALTQTVCRIRQLTLKVVSHSEKYKHHKMRLLTTGQEWWGRRRRKAQLTYRKGGKWKKNTTTHQELNAFLLYREPAHSLRLFGFFAALLPSFLSS